MAYLDITRTQTDIGIKKGAVLIDISGSPSSKDVVPFFNQRVRQPHHAYRYLPCGIPKLPISMELLLGFVTSNNKLRCPF